MSKIILNPDSKIVAEIRRQLIFNKGYCPCRIEHIDENKCMCKEFREQEEGECHCGLYIKIKENTNE